MNVRIDENSLRFRITEEELSQLLQGQELNMETVIGQNCFQAEIIPDPQDKRIFCHMTQESRLSLHIGQAHLRELADMGRNRKGVEAMQDPLQISLQVDIRADRRPRRAAR